MTPQPPRRSAGWGMVRATLQGDEPRQSNASDSGPQPRLSGVARLSGAEPQPRMSGALAGFAATAIARERQRKRDGGGDDATAPAAADDVASPPVARRSFTNPAPAAGARGKSVRMSVGGALTKRMSVWGGPRKSTVTVGGSRKASAVAPTPLDDRRLSTSPPPIPGRRKSTFQAAASALSGLATTPSMHAHGFGTDAATAAAAALRRQGSQISLNAGGGGGGGGDSFKSSVSRKASVARPTWAVAAPPPPTSAAIEARRSSVRQEGKRRSSTVSHETYNAHGSDTRRGTLIQEELAGILRAHREEAPAAAVTAAEASWSRNTSMDVVTPLNMMAARRSDRRTTDEDLDNPLWFEQGAWCNSREPSFMKAKKLTDAAADVAAASAAPAQDSFNADAARLQRVADVGEDRDLRRTVEHSDRGAMTTHLLLRSLADRIERRSCGDDGGDAPLQPLGARRTISAPAPSGRRRRPPSAEAASLRSTADGLTCPIDPSRRSGATRGRRRRRRNDATEVFVSRRGPCRSPLEAAAAAAGARRWCAVPVIHPLTTVLGRARSSDASAAALRHPALVSLSALLFVLHVALNFRTAISSKGVDRHAPTPARALCGSTSPSSAPSSARRGATRARRSHCSSRRGTCSCSRRSSRRRLRSEYADGCGGGARDGRALDVVHAHASYVRTT